MLECNTHVVHYVLQYAHAITPNPRDRFK